MKVCGTIVEILSKLSQLLSSRILTIKTFFFKYLQENNTFSVFQLISHLILKLRRTGITVLWKVLAVRTANILALFIALLEQSWMCLQSKALNLPYSVTKGRDTN
jgi:hypothetical protein